MMQPKHGKKPNKRELVENDGYYKHGKAKPYDRNKDKPQIDELDKAETLNQLLGDWDANGV